jgi:[acyl-carrier-protein] S-malonyltransferase
MVELGVDSFLEIGPGKVLSRLVSRIAKGVNSRNVEDFDTLKAL